MNEQAQQIHPKSGPRGYENHGVSRNKMLPVSLGSVEQGSWLTGGKLSEKRKGFCWDLIEYD